MNASRPSTPRRVASAAVVFAAGVTIGSGLTRLPLAAAQQTRPIAPTDRIHQLRVERRDLLKTIAHAVRIRTEKGQLSLDELPRAIIAQRKAELDLCETPAERVRVHEQLVEDLREVEGRYKAWVTAGRAVESAAYQTKARRLKAEIDLEQARLAAAAAP